MKILLATDGSACSDAAIEEVSSRPWPEGSEVKIISAVNQAAYFMPSPLAGAPNYYTEFDRLAHETAEAAVKSAAAKLGARVDKSLTVISKVIVGPPGRVVVEEAETWGADLIVVGSHGYGALNRFLLGSVSQAVSSHAPCSVEIVRRRPEDSGAGENGRQ